MRSTGRSAGTRAAGATDPWADRPLGFDGAKTIVDDYLRQIRPAITTAEGLPADDLRPGEICQFDLWEPREEIPVGHGQMREGWVIVVCLA